MTIHNLGSINIDLVFRVPHIPEPGETLLSYGMSRGLGGKGANTSVAVAKAGATIKHYGAIGHDGEWTINILQGYGVDCAGVLRLDMPSGQAIIQVDEAGENAITLLKGANWAFETNIIDSVLENAKTAEWLVLQNETAHVVAAAVTAKQSGLRVAYAAAPFDADATAAVLAHVDLLALNEIEAAQLAAATGKDIQDLPPKMILVTQGSKGATLYQLGKPSLFQPAEPVAVVKDTTAAGDTFFGFFLGCLENGYAVEECLKIASIAASFTVSRDGAAESIPTLAEVTARLG